MSLDHIVLAVPDLAGAVADFAGRTGVAPARGGSHVGLGSANHLVGLGGTAYLEIVGPDPDQPDPSGPRPFGIDELAGPRVVTWAVHPADVDAVVRAARAAGYDPGDAASMSRRTPDGELLEWRLTPPALDDGMGLVPFLIDWGTTPHPTTRDLPSVPLLEWRAEHPEPERVRAALTALGVELDVIQGPRPALVAVVGGADGPVRLGAPA
ncbi:MAG TPA: VOC family protein [Jatrophihabitans sp.]|jgi:hypothetical protein|uniref:VOC family protein n=1 Tax=Jatrophihabitans sp. TaxID=1932789 RepID=UPI002E0217E5|nr:VOC family protein [Jatrophihabitans sp.]